METNLASAGFSSITKLKGTANYALWKFEVQIFLDAAQVLEVADGSDVKPLIAGDAIKKWMTKDAMAKKVIVTTIEKQLLPHVLNCTTSAQMWSTLKNLFSKSTEHEKALLYQEFFAFSFPKNNDILMHVSKLENLFEQIRLLEPTLKDEILINKILQTLPDSYRSFHTGWDFLPEGNKTLITLKNRLLGEHNKSKDIKEETVAFFGGEKRKCHRCHRQGHLRKDCRVNLTSENKNKTGKNKTFDKNDNGESSSRYCKICKKNNHDEQQCFFRNKNGEDKNKTDKTGENKTVVFVANSGEIEKETWIIDSGSSYHLTFNRELLSDVTQSEVVIASAKEGEDIKALVQGRVCTDKCVLTDVLFSPEVSANLLSVACIVKNGGNVTFTDDKVVIHKNGRKILEGKRAENGIFTVRLKPTEAEAVPEEAVFLASKMQDIALWHRRLGHLSVGNMKRLEGMVDGMVLPTKANKVELVCDICPRAKQTRKPYKTVRTPATRLLELVHTDLCGPITPPTWDNNCSYFITFRCDYSGFSCVFLLKNKSEAFEAIKNYTAYAENRVEKRVATFRLDNGGEYSSNEFKDWCRLKGIVLQYAPPYSPNLNGESERLNRSIMEKARAMICNAKLNKNFWGFAVQAACHLLNRSPRNGKDKTPFEQWYNRKPNIKHLKVFGARVFAKTNSYLKKLDDRSQEYIFVGYAEQGYILYDPGACATITSRDVVFREDENFRSLNPRDQVRVIDKEDFEWIPATQLDENDVSERGGSDTEPGGNGSVDSDWSPSSDDEAPITGDKDNPELEPTGEPRYPGRVRNPPDFFVAGLYAPDSDCAEVEPQTVTQALRSADWKRAMQEEIDAINNNDTWTLIERPEHCNAVKCKWVFKLKKTAEGVPERKRARLVARGFSQKQGIDFDETFAPVVRHSTLRFLLALAVKFNLRVHHWDVSCAFLNGILKNVVYLEQPEGFKIKGKENHVYLLHKALYGLKQGSREWNLVIDEKLISLGFRKAISEPCVYFLIVESVIILIALYVDDLIFLFNDQKMADKIKQDLFREYEMRDLGPLHHCLGVRINIEENLGKIKSITLDQHQYIKNLLSKFNMEDAKGQLTPLEVKSKVQGEVPPENETVNNDLPYQNLVGALMYLAVNTRPDIAYSLSFLSQFNKNFSEQHWKSAKRVLRYLKQTIDRKIVYSLNDADKDKDCSMIGYVDADWGGNVKDRRSFSGFVFMFSGGPVSWEARKQKTVSLSSVESEYLAIGDSFREAMFLSHLYEEIFSGKMKINLQMFSDSNGALKLLRNPVCHGRTKHIAIRHHFVREVVKEGFISIKFLGTEKMVADIFTKALEKKKHYFCLNNLLK